MTHLKNSSKKLNVCLVYPGYPPYEQESGGIASYVQETVQFLTASGHNVVVISRAPGISHIIKKNTKGAHIIYLPHFLPRISKLFPLLKFNKYGAYFYSSKAYKYLNKIEKETHIRFDVIEASDWGGEGYFLVKKFPKRTIIKCDTPSFISESYNPNNPAYLSSFIKRLEQKTLLNAKNIVSNSKKLMQKINSVLHKKLSFTLIQLSMKTTPAYKTKYESKFSKNNPMKIIFSGRIEKRKGIFNLIKAVKQLRDQGIFLELYCFGASTPVKQTDTITILQNKGYEWLHFYGSVPRKQMIEQYKNYDLCVVPSVFDSFCLTALEAIYSKLPTIMSNTTGITDLISDKSLVFCSFDEMLLKLKDAYYNYSTYISAINSTSTELYHKTQTANRDRLNYYYKVSTT